MKIGIAVTLVIVVLFAWGLMLAHAHASKSVSFLKNNWAEHRCNPLVMPFAGLAGHDTMTNFTNCVQNSQTSFMGYLLKPVHYNTTALGGITGKLGGSVNDIRAFFSKIRDFIGNITETIVHIVLNVVTMMITNTIVTRDILSKNAGTFAALMYMGESVTDMSVSAWAGLPGETVRAICFDPETLVRDIDGDVHRMCDIPLNTVLSNGARVLAALRISNLDADGQNRETMWRLPQGEMGNPISVTGHHLVYDSEATNFVYAQDHPDSARTSEAPAALSCLVTSNHTIPIGDYVFHDWEDGQKSGIV